MKKAAFISLMLITGYPADAYYDNSFLGRMRQRSESNISNEWLNQNIHLYSQAIKLRECLINLYFGDVDEAIRHYKDAIRSNDHYFNKSSIPKVDNSLAQPQCKIVEKDGFLFIEEDQEPAGMVKVEIAESNDTKISHVLIPENHYESFVKQNKSDMNQISRVYGKKPKKEIKDPIYKLLDIDDSHATKELVERINKTVEYRRTKTKWFWEWR